MNLYIYCVAMPASIGKSKFYFTTLDREEKSLDYIYDDLFLHGKIAQPKMQKCIVFSACDLLNVLKVVACLPAVVHVSQYVKPWHKTRLYFLSLNYLFELNALTFLYLGA